MAQPPPERASSGNKPRGSSAGPRGREDHPLTDGYLLALLGGVDPDLLAAIARMRAASLDKALSR